MIKAVLPRCTAEQVSRQIMKLADARILDSARRPLNL